jgi:hypothetical protein
MFHALTLRMLTVVVSGQNTLTVNDMTVEHACASQAVLEKQLNAQFQTAGSNPVPSGETYSVTFSNPPPEAALPLSAADNRKRTTALAPQLWRAVIGGRNGTRVLEDFSLTCEALSQAVAVSLTLLLRNVPSTPQTPVSERTFTRSASLGLGLASPWITPVSLFLSLGSDFAIGTRLWLGAGAFGFLPSTRSAPPGEVRALAGGGVLRGGIRLQATPSIELRPGAALWLGAIIGSGMGYAANRQVAEWWLAFDLEFTAAWISSSGFGVFARAAALLSLRRPAFDVSGVGTLLQTPVITGLFEIGPQLRW